MSIYVDSKFWIVFVLVEVKCNGQKLVMLIVYDVGFVCSFDVNGVDLILIGDLLGMVVQGYDLILLVIIDDMVYYICVVVWVVQCVLVIVDLLFGVDVSLECVFEVLVCLLQVGVEMVKIEGVGFKLDVICYLVECEILVCLYLGLILQLVLCLGGYCVQGCGDVVCQLVEDVKVVVEVGVIFMVLECLFMLVVVVVIVVVMVLIIGIGVGLVCDGQVLVLYDFFGLDSGYCWFKFVKDFLVEGGFIVGVVCVFVDVVCDGFFFDVEYVYVL